ncbi:MAG: hypothetical protein HYY06_16825 [Deltaproteobacteria bacterium]|nr:hypothetical protein [Deltaproteobacteria bacterium]
MAHAYTPGLKVTERAVIRKQRRLPLAGEVLVEEGQPLRSSDVVARADLPGKVYPLNVGGQLNVLPEDLPHVMSKKEGDRVAKDEVIAETAGIFGLFKSRSKAPVAGFVESISRRTGQVMLREAPIPIEVDAYVDGRVVEVFPTEGVAVECEGVFVQGIFGLAGEVHGPIRMIAGPGERLNDSMITPELRGAIAVGGSLLGIDVYRAAVTAGLSAIVVGGMHYRDIKQILGYELGVAITGHEKLGTTVIVTEGFGEIAMARGTHTLLERHQGELAAANGATQIRAGVIRPEVIIPSLDRSAGASAEPDGPPEGIAVGSTIRVIRAPHFGRLATVVSLPVELREMESETMVRVLEARFDDGTEVVVPRSNVEMIERR